MKRTPKAAVFVAALGVTATTLTATATTAAAATSPEPNRTSAVTLANETTEATEATEATETPATRGPGTGRDPILMPPETTTYTNRAQALRELRAIKAVSRAAFARAVVVETESVDGNGNSNSFINGIVAGPKGGYWVGLEDQRPYLLSGNFNGWNGAYISSLIPESQFFIKNPSPIAEAFKELGVSADTQIKIPVRDFDKWGLAGYPESSEIPSGPIAPSQVKENIQYLTPIMGVNQLIRLMGGDPKFGKLTVTVTGNTRTYELVTPHSNEQITAENWVAVNWSVSSPAAVIEKTAQAWGVEDVQVPEAPTSVIESKDIYPKVQHLFATAAENDTRGWLKANMQDIAALMSKKTTTENATKKIQKTLEDLSYYVTKLASTRIDGNTVTATFRSPHSKFRINVTWKTKTGDIRVGPVIKVLKLDKTSANEISANEIPGHKEALQNRP